MSRERRYVGVALMLALPMSQHGHGLAYLLQRVASDRGVHAYFPGLLTSVEWALAAAILGALVVVGLARTFNPAWKPARLPLG